MVMASPASSRTPHLLLLLYAGCFLLSLSLDAPRSIAAAAASPVSFSFDFSNTSTQSLEDLKFEGNASFHGKLVDLTCNSYGMTINNCTGRMSYNHPVPFYDKSTRELASFTTRFTFAILPDSKTMKNTGDGMAFFLASYPSSMPQDSGGGNLGLRGRSSDGSGPDRFVAVEFDTFNNSWEQPRKTYDHIGIDISSVRKSVNTTSLSSFGLNGSMTASITFDNTTWMLVASLQFDDHPSLRPVQVSTKLLDPRTLLPSEVAVGFSGATFAHTELHQIMSWSFNSTLAPLQKGTQVDSSVSSVARRGAVQLKSNGSGGR